MNTYGNKKNTYGYKKTPRNTLLSSLRNVASQQGLRESDYEGTLNTLAQRRDVARSEAAEATSNFRNASGVPAGYYQTMKEKERDLKTAEKTYDDTAKYINSKKKKGKRALTGNLNLSSLPY